MGSPQLPALVSRSLAQAPEIPEEYRSDLALVYIAGLTLDHSLDTPVMTKEPSHRLPSKPSRVQVHCDESLTFSPTRHLEVEMLLTILNGRNKEKSETTQAQAYGTGSSTTGLTR